MQDLVAPHTHRDSLATIHALRPTMPLVPRTIVEAIQQSGGPIGSSTTVARQFGLSSRFKLARLLKQAGLPPLHRLAEWALVESWLRRAEHDGLSLCHMAFRSGRYPSACYRLVKELTGLTWGELRARGLRWFQQEFVSHLARSARS